MLIISYMLDANQVEAMSKLYIMMALLTLIGWAGVARMVRGQILYLREQEYMMAAEATGLSLWRKLFKHLLPNVLPQLIVSMTLGLGGIILTEATLGFLGLGVPQEYATWGNMINAGVWSPYSLYSEEIATFGESDYNQKDAEGFINLYGLPIQVQAIVDGRK